MVADPSNGAKKTLGSVNKAFDILEQIKSEGSVGLSELAHNLDLPKSTVHIHLQTLQNRNFVVQDGDEYTLSYRFLNYGGELRNQSKLFRAARSEVDKLEETTGEVASLGIEENGLRVLIYKSEGRDSIHDNAPVGEYTHMHWTALGKAILAHYSIEHVESIVDERGLPRANEHTITDREELFEELEQTRERGYSVEDQDRRQGVLTIGAPIHSRSTDDIIASVSVSGPKNRMEEDNRFNEIVTAVKKAANVIELSYSHY
ncbi:IclR family transcriptional regulator [Halobacterium noricense]|jgi:DNA-binding IclR family transcriptional regulator|uniref:IclR family transcriptional regulator n=1 Tax=Halobacterium noricense TaxID=223182 RepID=UPI001E540FDE|nr:IclR family transcriptional regulator [Halobacterium noricense]UHH27199.1 IclR family transcriptional regulator [Halobacterium noricense]